MEKSSSKTGASAQTKETVKDLQDQVLAAGEQFRDQTQEIWKEANRFIRKNPGVAVGVAVAAGAALGGLLIQALSEPQRPTTYEAARESMSEKLAQLRDVLDGAIRKLK